MFSQRDKNVLNMIMNPNLPFVNADDSANEEETGQQEGAADYLNLPNYKESELLDLEGVKLAENGEMDAALVKFNEAIQLCAGNPCPYNNRAQLHRMNGKIEEALADLEKSLELSKGKGRTAAQSFVQRAMVYRLQGKEEWAKDEFEKAAKLGSNFAKNQLVSMNPYAAMCNKMLGEIMTKFKRGEE